MKATKQRIAIFASGNGTNAENVILYFQNHATIEVACVLSNKADAFVLERAKKYRIPTYIFQKTDFYETNKVLEILQKEQISWIILAGFLWLVPENILQAFPNKIINIHPALLPKYGGKGMYGNRVHQAVWENKETETGITIHFANAHYDEGQIIFQARIALLPEDTPESIAQKVHYLEYEHFPKVIEQTILASQNV
ncbi:phosphoribosylglycinamide formyltransferase [Raineya orbicola]|uniref:Phosphoribosylglycinamide formyltransferase n=1 Tax=Raineya orbicola TaxID=2016530 RepID=A0A2N3IEV9_9BACT|nr:phosphoribosylglycinamide formyltransferase [Raineya orbicola]PKQ68864.1 PurN: phosphoribosylglycinamide formyltransferase [Raineya orbicola]